MENKVKVTIFGQEYTIRGDASPEHIQQLAEYIDGKMRDISSQASSSSPMQVAILMALNVVDEYFQLKNLKQGMDGAIEKKTMELISMLDEGIIGDIFSRQGQSPPSSMVRT